MNNLDVDEFVQDYCSGIKDKEIFVKHNLTPKEFLATIKMLMEQGLLSREDYFSRNKRIEQLEAKQEREILKSLYHCPVCSHIHPSAFTICPACGADVSAPATETIEDAPGVYQFNLDEDDEAVSSAQTTSFHEPSDESAITEVPVTQVQPPEKPEAITAEMRLKTETRITKAIEGAANPDPIMSIPEDLFRKIGMPLEDLNLFDQDSSQFDYHVSELTYSGHKAVVFKAEDDNAIGRDIAVKVFRPGIYPDEIFADLLKNVIAFQRNMDDINVLAAIGVCIFDDQPALLYQYYPRTLAQALEKYPNGLPMDNISILLPQIFNGLGYSHMHRGRDGVIRRLPHGNLKLSKLLVNDDLTNLVIEDCGLWSGLSEVKGHKQYFWEEPGVDLSTLAPESFVIESKFVNCFLMDIYALGSVLYKMVTNKSPFTGNSVKEYSFLHLRTFPIPPRVHRWDVPGWLDHMILKCLNKEPAKRWRSATQMELSIGKGVQE